MVEIINFVMSFVLGTITGAFLLYAKLLKDIKYFDKQYAAVLLTIKKDED